MSKLRFECATCGAILGSDKKPKRCSCGGKSNFTLLSVEHPVEDVNFAEEMFKSPKLLNNIEEELSKDHIGDNNLKMTTLLVCISALLQNSKRRQSIALTGNTSEGKDNMIKACLKHMPQDSYIFLTSGTEATIQDDIKDVRILAFSELNLFKENGANKHLLEVIKQRTEGGTSVVKKDVRDKGKTMRHEEAEQATVIFGTTDSERDEELNTRFMSGTIKASENRIRKVNYNTFDYFSSPKKILEDSKIEDSWIKIRLTHFIHGKQYQVFLPYASFLKEKINENDIFDYKDPRSQRDIKRLLSLTCAMTYLFQDQREKKEVAKIKFLISEPQDLINTIRYTQDFFNQTYTGVDARLSDVLKIIDNYPDQWIDRKIIQDELGIAKNTIIDYCRTLSREGLIEGSKGSKLNDERGQKVFDGNRIYYRRVQQGCKKKLLRVKIKELRLFLEEKTQKHIEPFDEEDFIDDNQEENDAERVQNKEVKNEEDKRINNENTDRNAKIEPLKLNSFLPTENYPEVIQNEEN